MFPMNEQMMNMFKTMFPMNAIPPNLAFPPNLAPNAFPANEKMSSLIRANVDAQLSAATSLTGTAVESLQRLVELNLNAARASLEDSTTVTKQLMAAKDAQEFMSLTVAQAQPTLAKALSYSRHLADIATAAQDSLARATAEQIAETNNRLHDIVDDAAKSAPAGSNNVIEMMRMAMNTASANYQRMNRTAQQAAEQAQANMTNAVNQFASAAETATSGGGRGK
ncbi:MAG TPA: phasin family protein [Noviherbaspirillum sp.]